MPETLDDFVETLREYCASIPSQLDPKRIFGEFCIAYAPFFGEPKTELVIAGNNSNEMEFLVQTGLVAIIKDVDSGTNVYYPNSRGIDFLMHLPKSITPHILSEEVVALKQRSEP